MIDNKRKLRAERPIHHSTIFQLLQLVCSGLLAGLEIAVHYGIAISPESVGEAAQIVIRQALIRRLRVLAPAIFLPCFVLALVVMVQQWHQPGIRSRALGVVGLLIWILIRVVRTVPVNSATMEWNPNSPPANWRALVKTAERFHVVAAWAAVTSFVCFLIPALQV